MRNSLRLVFLLMLLAVVAMAGAGCTKQAKLSRLLERADKYYADGDYDKADVEYINVLRLDPKSAKAIGRIGIMSLEQGRLGRAYRPLARACELDTNNVEFHTKLGLFFLAVGKSKEARDEAYFVLARQPDNEEAPLLVADAAGQLNDIESSRLRLQKLVVAPAKRAPIDVALGNLAFHQRDMKGAMAAFESARAIDPKFSPLHTSLAFYYWSQKDVAHADQEFKVAIATLPVRSQIRLRYAQFKMQTGDVAGAKAILEDLVQKAPDFLPALKGLAELAAAGKKYEEASAYEDKILTRDPENYDGLLMKGQYALEQGNASQAVTEFEKMTRAYPKSTVAFYGLAMAYNALKDIPKMTANLNQALALNPNYIEAALALDEIKVKKGDYSSAIVSLRQLLQQRPQLIPAQILLASAYHGRANYDEAARIYRQLEETYPTNAQMPMLLGDLLFEERHDSEAQKEFLKAFELAPNYMMALERATDVDLTNRNYSEALQRVQKFADKWPTNAEPKMLVAKVRFAQGDLKEAVSVLDNIMTAHPDFTPAYLMLAKAYEDGNDPKHALEITHKLLAKSPNNPGGEVLLATISNDQKDYKTAVPAYEKVLENTPDNTVALNNLAYIHTVNGNLDKAFELARKARELLPRDPSTADTLGWILFKRGDYEQAAGLLQESVNVYSAVPEIQLHYGLAQYMLGNEDTARLSLQYAASSKSDFPEKDSAARSLAILNIDPNSAGADARGALEKRVSEQPGDTVALGRLAAIYIRNGETDKAISTYETALKHNAKNPKTFLALARIYSSRPGEQAKALEMAKSAYKLAPENPEVSHLTGRLAYVTGDYKLSYDLLKESSRKRPGDAELQFDFAEAAYSEGRLEEAETAMGSALQGTAFTRATEAKRFMDIAPLAENASAATAASAQVDQVLKTDPGYVPALMAHGIIQESKNDTASAKQDYEKALNHFPDFSRAKRRLAILSAQSGGDDKQAYAFATQALEAFPDDPELDKTLGIIVYRQGDYSRSATYLKQSAAKRNGDAQTMYWLGMAQYKLREKAESKRSLLQAIDLKLPDNMATEAKKVLAQLN